MLFYTLINYWNSDRNTLVKNLSLHGWCFSCAIIHTWLQFYSYMYTTISAQLNLHSYFFWHGSGGQNLYVPWAIMERLERRAAGPLVHSSCFGFQHYKLTKQSVFYILIWQVVNILSSLGCNILSRYYWYNTFCSVNFFKFI